MWWFDKGDARALFGDRRRGTIAVTDRSHGRKDGQRVLRIEPDVELDFRALPFADGSFSLVAFDPPHLVRAGARSWMAAKYGKLGQDWREDLETGFRECFRVLRPLGVLVFKWSEVHVPVGHVVALSPIAPLFGNTSGRRAGTHWIVFMKPGEG
jgi:SAM-dependent methyltransferase